MTSFWIAVGVSLFAASLYLLSSIKEQMDSKDKILEQVFEATSAQSKLHLVIPLLLIIAVPFSYSYLGGADEQKNWQSSVHKMENIVLGRFSSAKDNDIQSMLLALRSLIEKDPENGQLWFMLAEGYFQLNFIDLANESMQRAIRLEPRPDWLVANAQILSVRSNANDISKSINMLQNALSIQPNHQSALLTLGFLYLRQQQYRFAIVTWERLLVLLEGSGNDTKTIKKQIEFARQQLELTKKDT